APVVGGVVLRIAMDRAGVRVPVGAAVRGDRGGAIRVAGQAVNRCAGRQRVGERIGQGRITRLLRPGYGTPCAARAAAAGEEDDAEQEEAVAELHEWGRTCTEPFSGRSRML